MLFFPKNDSDLKHESTVTLLGGFSFFFLTGCSFSFSWFRLILRNCSWILKKKVLKKNANKVSLQEKHFLIFFFFFYEVGRNVLFYLYYFLSSANRQFLLSVLFDAVPFLLYNLPFCSVLEWSCQHSSNSLTISCIVFVFRPTKHWYEGILMREETRVPI